MEVLTTEISCSSAICTTCHGVSSWVLGISHTIWIWQLPGASHKCIGR